MILLFHLLTTNLIKIIKMLTISGLGIGGTYIEKVPFLRIDYIWHNKNLESIILKLILLNILTTELYQLIFYFNIL